MGLGSEMKNLSEDILASFKERIRANEELVNEVQKTLDGFHKNQQEMAAVLNANAASLIKGLARGETERLNTFKDLMTGIHHSITSIEKEVEGIQSSTLNLMKGFTTGRLQMAANLNKFFLQGRADRKQDEKIRMNEFDTLIKNISNDIKSINAEVSTILKNTNGMLDRFEKEHLEMSEDMRAEIGKNLAERVEYTSALLNGFQKKLSEISKENQQTAQKLKKELANGETERLNEYDTIMKEIHAAIKGIRAEVKAGKNSTEIMLEDFLQNRVQASSVWNKMQNVMSEIRKTGVASPHKEAVKKVEKAETKMGPPVQLFTGIPTETAKQTFVKNEKTIPIKEKLSLTSPPSELMTINEKVLDFIKKHPKGVKISAMEKPLGETRMKLGFVAKNLLDEGKILKLENIYYPKPKITK